MKTDNKMKMKFYDEMRESLLRLKPDEMEITFKRISKQNRKGLHGCILQLPGSEAAPTFYLEDLYSAYENGTAADDIAESLINFAKENNLKALPGGIDLDDYECVKQNLGLCVIGIDRNEEYLKDMVYETVEDLALIPMIFTNDSYGPGNIKVRHSFLDMWGVTGEEVMREAKENSPKLLPLTFKQLGEELGVKTDEEDCELFVISNTYYAGGAAVAFYPRVLECIGMALNRDLFVLPSSVNEMLLLTDNGQDPSTLLQIVKEVNRTQLAPQDILSDAVYYYSRKDNAFRRIQPAYA